MSITNPTSEPARILAVSAWPTTGRRRVSGAGDRLGRDADPDFPALTTGDKGIIARFELPEE
jgi:hypothetical protein